NCATAWSRSPGWWKWRSDAPSLDVLHLFLDAVDRAFDFDDGAADGGVVALAADGVGFAEHFLGDEVERAAVGGVAGALDVLRELIEMARQAAEFLVDVGPLGEDGD